MIQGFSHAYANGAAFFDDRVVSNLTDLWDVGKHPGLSDMMRMSVVEEIYI